MHRQEPCPARSARAAQRRSLAKRLAGTLTAGIALTGLLALIACTPSPPSPLPDPRSTGIGYEDLRFRHILVIEVDTLRADHLSAYGYGRETLPKTMQRPWLVVEGYTAASSWTVPSTSSVMTGLDVHHHGLWDVQDQGPVDPLTAPTMGSVFTAAGFSTGLYSGNAFLTPLTNMGDGFQEKVLEPLPGGGAELATLSPHILNWLDSVAVNGAGSSDFLVFTQPMDAHQPIQPDLQDRGTWSRADLLFDPDATRQDQAAQIADAWATGTPEQRSQLTTDVRDVYDETLLGLDRSIDVLLAELQTLGVLDTTLVVLTADHGETIFEDDSYTHGNTLRRELVHIPLLLLAPGLTEGPVDCLSSQTDLLPTLLRFAGEPPLEGVDGRAIQDSCRASTRSVLLANDNIAWLDAATSTETLSWACSPTGTAAYGFDVATDPAALNPVAAADLKDGEKLIEQLAALAAEITAGRPTFTCASPI